MRTFAFVPGAVMIVAAAVWAAFALRWSVPSGVLAGGGVLALAVGIAANWKGLGLFLAQRSIDALRYKRS